MKKTIPFLLCLFVGCMAYGQHVHSYVYSRLGKVNGLAADAAYCVAEDREGFIWVGTENGLQRYDGSRFITFRHVRGDAGSLPYNKVQSLMFDSKGRLWIKTGDVYLGYFNTTTRRYTPVKVVIPDSLRNSGGLTFKESSDGTISINMANYGLVTYNEERNEFSAAYNRVKLPGGIIPDDVREDRKTGRYWVTSSLGFDLFDAKQGKLVPRDSDSVLKKMNEESRLLGAHGPAGSFADSKGRYWGILWKYLAKNGGPELYGYNPAFKKWSLYKNSLDEAAGSYHVIDGMLEQKNGDMWVYGTNIFAKLNEQTNEFEDVRNESLRLHGLNVESIFQMIEDREKNLWIACTNGLYLFNPGNQVFTHINNRREFDKVYTHSTDAVLQTKSGLIYTSAWGAGLFAYDSNLNAVPNPILPTEKDNDAIAVWDMHERNNGEIWMGLQGGSLWVHQQATQRTTKLALPVFENHTLRQLAEDSLGNIWIGTQKGLVIKCLQANWRDTAHAYQLIRRVNGNVLCLVADNKGFIWVGTDWFGLYKLNAADGSLVAHYNNRGPEGKRLQSAGVSDVLPHNDSLVLIASDGINVLNTRTGAIHFITTEDGLPSGHAVSLTKDRQGYVWAGMLSGVARLWIGENFINTFGLEDGIDNNHFQINASTLLRDGRMILGTSTGFLLFNPAQITVSRKAIPVYISGFKVNDRELRVDSLLQLKKVVLPHTDNSIVIDATTHTYTQTYGITYMLEGIDREWKIATNRQINLNYLQPGTYTLKIKVARGERNEPDTITQLVIEIVPPIWNRSWFYALIILTVAGIFYLADRERLARIRSNEKIRTDIALSLHYDVNMALNNINLLSEMARMKADKDIVKSKALIEQISAKSNKIIIAMDDMLWSIDPANDSMEKTFLRMTEFADSLRNRHEANIVIRIDKKVSVLKFDMKLRHGFFLIFKEALRAVVQYSGSKEALVNIDFVKNHLYLKMHSAQPLDYTDGQLVKSVAEIKSQAEAIGAEIDIQSDKGGSDIILRVAAA